MEISKELWKDRKRPIFGLPLSFTRYRLTEEKLIVTTGILSTKEEEVQLYRIMDLTLHRSIWQRMFGVGTIHCCSGDKTTPEFDIKDVKNPIQVKDLISKSVEEERNRKKIASREFMDFEEDEHF